MDQEFSVTISDLSMDNSDPEEPQWAGDSALPGEENRESNNVLSAGKGGTFLKGIKGIFTKKYTGESRIQIFPKTVLIPIH